MATLKQIQDALAQAQADAAAEHVQVSAEVQKLKDIISPPAPTPPPVPAGTFPAWRMGLPNNVFTDIPGSNPSALTNAIFPQAMFDSYCGLGTDTETGRIYSFGGGGHGCGTDQTGVWMLDMMVDAPKWSTLAPIYAGGQSTIYDGKQYFPDGTPTGSHTYSTNMLINIAGRKGLLNMYGSTGAALGNLAPAHTNCFWLDTNSWDLNGVGWPAWGDSGLMGVENGCDIDPATQNIYMTGPTGSGAPYAFRYFNPNTKTWATWAGNGWGFQGAMCYVPDLNAMVMDYGSYRGGSMLGNNWSMCPIGWVHTTITLNWITPKPPGFGGQSGFAYDADLGYIYWLCNKYLMRVKIRTWEVEYIADVPAIVPGQNVYNRMKYIPALKGIYYAPHWSVPVQFMPTTADSIMPPSHLPAATITANGVIYPTLQAACDTGLPVTIGAGAVYTGAIINKPGTTITGAGKTLTHFIGGVVGLKAELVVEVDTAITGVSFEDTNSVGQGNEAGIRHDAGQLAATDCNFARCFNGYLGNANVDFLRCYYDSCGTGTGFTHAVYASNGGTLVTSTDGHFKGTKVGHHLKSRASATTLTRNVMEAGTESYSCDFPWGGVVNIDQLTAAQGALGQNAVLINFGSETNPTPYATHSLAISNSPLSSSGVANAVAVRIDPKTPCVPIFTNVPFTGFTTLCNVPATYSGCTKDGVAIPDGTH